MRSDGASPGRCSRRRSAHGPRRAAGRPGGAGARAVRRGRGRHGRRVAPRRASRSCTPSTGSCVRLAESGSRCCSWSTTPTGPTSPRCASSCISPAAVRPADRASWSAPARASSARASSCGSWRASLRAQIRALPSLGAGGGGRARATAPAACADDEFCRRCFELTAGNPLQLRELLAAIEQQAQPADAATLAAGGRGGGPFARALGAAAACCAVARRAGAGARRGGVRGRRSPAPGGGADRSDRRRGAGGRGRARARGRAAARRSARLHPSAGPSRGLRRPAVRRARAHASPRRAAAGRVRLLARVRELASARGRARGRRRRGGATCGRRRSARWRAGRRRRRCAIWSARCGSLPRRRQRPAVLAELGRAEAAAGLPDAVAHLEAAIGSRRRAAAAGRAVARVRPGAPAQRTPERRVRRRSSAGATSSASGAASWPSTWRRGYLAAAMQAPDRAAAAHRAGGRHPRGRATEQPRRARAREQGHDHAPVGRRAPRGDPRHRAAALRATPSARTSDRDDSRAIVHSPVASACATTIAAAERALGQHVRRRAAAGSASMFAAASQLRSRQRLWTGPDRRCRARRPRRVRRLARRAAHVPASRRLLPGHRPAGAGRARRGRERPGARRRASRPPSASSPRGGNTALGRLAVRRGERRRRPSRRSWRPAGTSASCSPSNPTRAAVALGGGLAAQRLGRHEQARSLIADELALAERFGAPRAIGVARRAAGLLERGDAAVERLRSAVEPLAALRRPRRAGPHPDRARRRDPPRRTRHRGARHAARGARARRGRGATALARRAREELRLAGGRAPAHVDAERRRAHAQRAPHRRAGGRGPDQPADRRRALHHRQERRVAPEQRVPQARHPRPRQLAPRSANPGVNPGGSPP